MAEEKVEQAPKKKVDRSPRYPAIPLAKAIERAREFYKQEGKHSAKPEVAVTHWKYTPKSSGGKLTLAALRSFGLLENAADGVKLSDRGLRIILDEREPSPERTAFIKEAALSPKIHKKLWDRFKADLPSQASLKHTLLMEFEFAAGAIDDFIGEYRSTLAFAGLNDSAIMGEPEKVKSPAKSPFSVGDLVDWESQGVLQNAQPLQIRGISDDGAFAFVEGGNTGLPISELTRVEGSPVAKPSTEQPPALPPPAPPAAQGGAAAIIPAQGGVKQDVFSLVEGQAVLRWPETLSKESYADFADWLGLVMRKVARAAGVQVGKEPGRPA
jgi:hypothetical protein